MKRLFLLIIRCHFLVGFLGAGGFFVVLVLPALLVPVDLFVAAVVGLGLTGLFLAAGPGFGVDGFTSAFFPANLDLELLEFFLTGFDAFCSSAFFAAAFFSVIKAG